MTHLNPIRSALCGAVAALGLVAAARPAAAQSFNFRAQNAQVLATTYASLDTAGTVIATANFDDADSAPQNIGFSFPYNGSTFSSFILSSNGFIKLGSSPLSDPYLYLVYAQTEMVNGQLVYPGGPIASSDSRSNNIIAPLAVDLAGALSGGTEYRVATTGVAPNRVCTIQWKNVRDKPKQASASNTTTIGTQYASISFQVKLYETSGQVDFVYGPNTAGPGPDAFRSVAVGLKGNNNGQGLAGDVVMVDKASATAWSSAVFYDNYYVGTDPFNIRSSVRPVAGNTYRFRANAANDADVAAVYTLGQVPVGRSLAVQAVVRNVGTQTLTNLPVTLNVSGVNTFSNVQLVGSLAPGASTTVTFAPYTTSAQRGNNAVAVSVPADAYAVRNSLQVTQAVTASTLNYVQPIAGSGITPSYYGFDTREGITAVKFNNPTVSTLLSVTNFIPTGSNSVGQVIYAVALNAAGTQMVRTPDYTVRAADLGTNVTFNFTTPVALPAGDFLVGIAQPASAVAHYPIGLLFETPVRPGAFYDRGSLTTGTFSDRSLVSFGPFLIGAVLAPSPVISGFTPASGPVGTSVRVNGANFNGTTAVTFNGTTAPGFAVDTAGTSLTVLVPAGASTGPIAVATAGGTATSPTSFTVTVAPTITSLSRPQGPVSSTVLINGTGFTGATAVTFNGTAASFTVNSSTQISAVVPAGATSGPIQVTTPNGSATSASFTVLADPVVYSFSPASGAPGTQVIITGANFVDVGVVAFGQGALIGTGFTVNSPNQITAFVPANATTGFIGVNNGGSTGLSGTVFTVVAAPTNLTVSSAQNISGSYNNVTITGTGVATLTGPLSVAGTLTVQTGGALLTNCQPVRGLGSFTLQGGATLGICDAGGIRASGDTLGAIRLSGARSFSSDAVYRYNGSQAQVTGSGLPAQVRTLELSNASGLRLSQPAAVAQVLRLNSGDLSTNGQMLTLLSSATGTALVDNTGGVVNGTTTVQRYISPALNAGLGYRHLATPVTFDPVSDLATSNFTPVVNPAYNTSATPSLVTPFPTVFGYDQSRLATTTNNLSAFDKGWFSPAALTSQLNAGQGYTVNMAAGQTVDFVGGLINGNYFYNFARGTDAAAGWQLLGNPYPAPLDWSRVAAADRAGLNAAIYVFESTGPYAGRYRSYANGIGGNPIVPLGQGFFVRVADGQTSAALTLRNSHRLTSPDATPLLRGTADVRPQVQLALQGAGLADAAYVYFEAGATNSADAEYDARKLPNTNGLNLAALAGPEALAVNGLPALTTTTVVPLQVAVPAAGSYTLRAEQLLNFVAGTQVLLHDALTGQDIDLQRQASYSFTHSGASTSRFSLVFRPSGVTATASARLADQLMVFPNPTAGSFTVRLSGVAVGQPADAVLYNALGQAVQRRALPLTSSGLQAEFDVTRLPAGVYTLRLALADGTQLTKRVVKQ
ncbi:T9SS type A sorting domain-containing protein [Hymenobacter edaphi]|uniref:IPT/TIG domain-containing protein n=1 Tax=Hymenobacter edaphi TaxID=2211146 RepID=A0A328B7Z1_9BACT|nr:T9SS type A sorting domain-containing protein [Hymenobacter edaphi]RAK62969.1 hypothetical protein DLM85_22500 [Hymenobacter edaphi]